MADPRRDSPPERTSAIALCQASGRIRLCEQVEMEVMKYPIPPTVPAKRAGPSEWRTAL